MTKAELKEKANSLPLLPGVYIMRASDGTVIYVGKAKALKNRVTQYFGSDTNHSEKTRRMVANVSEFEYFLTTTETEAFLLENTLIKKYKPKYNILLKDDKTYPYIKVDIKSEYPVLSLERKYKNDGSRYFGPYSSSAKKIIELADRIFRLPDCGKDMSRIAKRPCLNFSIGRCLAPCSREISAQEYRDSIEDAMLFLNKDYKKTAESLSKKMLAASDELAFEKAAKYRDMLKAVNALKEKQSVLASPQTNADVFSVKSDERNICFLLLVVRDGQIQDKKSYCFGLFDIEDEKSALSEVIQRHYAESEYVPPQILVRQLPEDCDAISTWLTEQAKRKVELFSPKRGQLVKLIDIADENAVEALRKYNSKEAKADQQLAALAYATESEVVFSRIEAYDIANTADFGRVCGMIVFTDGVADKKEYRTFKIKTFEGQDDYRSMAEAVKRRFARYKIGDESFTKMPDAIMVDGGKGHVAVIKQVLSELKISVPVYGMVKDDKHRTRALTDGETELALDKDAFALIYAIQEQVHRFSQAYHNKLRKYTVSQSELLNIEGVGPKRAKELMKKFKTITAISKASFDELLEVNGMNSAAAKKITEYFAKPIDKRM